MKSQALFIAQPKYETKTWDDLPLAAEAASKLAVELAARGYELGYRDLLSGGDKQTIEKAVDDWFTHVADSSYVLLVWTGHGYTDGVKHYLICRSSPRNGVSGFNAIETGGLGVGDIAENLGKILATRTQVAGQQRAFAIIASAHPLEAAKEGILLRSLRTALLEPNLSPDKRRWTDHDEFINSGISPRLLDC